MTVLTNLIPTAFATYIEPFWVVLNRLLCLLKPFDELRAGDAQPEGTIEARYASVPPQLTLFDALKAKHYLLAFICAVALSTNILAVALSGLFNENAVWVAIPTTTTPRFADAFSDELYIIAGSSRGSAGNTGFQHLDSYYAMLANYSGNAPLPPWVDTKYYYMPFDIPAGPDGSNGTEVGIDIAAYEAQTRGYGIELDCKVPSTQRGAEDNIEFSALAPEPGRPSATLFFTLSHTLDNGTEIKCGPEHGTNESTKMFPRQFPGNGTARLEGLGPLAPQPGPAGMYDNYCFLQFVYGLGRLGPVPDNTTTPEADLKNATDGRSVDGSFIQCQPSFKTAMFDVRVDAQGRIQSSNRTTEFADNFDFLEGRPLFDDDPVTAILMQINEMTANPQPLVFQFEWNAHSFVRHWMSSAIITRRNSSEWYDVDKPLPPPEAMIKDVKAVYELNAAIILSFAETLFKPPIEGSTMAVDLIVKQERIFLEPAMLYICIVLLVIQLLALLAFYTHRPGQFLPRMPLSVASLIGFVAASHAVQEAGSEKSKDTRYGYGRFRGVDGRSHVGIDKMPVIPLESVNPESKKRGRLSVLIGREKAPGSPRFWI